MVRRLLFLTLMTLLGSGGILHAQGVACQTLKSVGMPLIPNGQDISAAEAMKEAIVATEKTFGPDHPPLATTLDSVALLSQRGRETAAVAADPSRWLSTHRDVRFEG